MPTTGSLPTTRSVRHVSALGDWMQHECRPAALAAAVESIWEVDGAVAHPRARIFPNGRADVLFNLGPPQRLVEGDGPGRFDRACVSGLQSRPLIVESARRTHLFGVRFRPEGAYATLGGASAAVAGRVVDLRDVLGGVAAPLAGRIAAAPSFRDRALVVCRWVEECAGRRRAPEAYVSWIAARIEAAHGAVAIGDLRRAAGVSPKKLATDFRNQIGSAPKTLARIARFKRAMEMLQGGGHSLTDVALASGYYDHSHLTLDFREFAGLTPGELLGAGYPDGTSAAER